MSVQQHPLHQAWSEALDHMIEAERHYYTAVMENKPEAEVQTAARDLDAAREAYHAIAGQIG